jgi:hypothetical protein
MTRPERTDLVDTAASTYAQRMPVEPDAGKPKRKAMFLSPEALDNLATTSARRRTEREAMEEALALLAERDARHDALDEFIEWATTEWGAPTPAERAEAARILAQRR